MSFASICSVDVNDAINIYFDHRAIAPRLENNDLRSDSYSHWPCQTCALSLFITVKRLWRIQLTDTHARVRHNAGIILLIRHQHIAPLLPSFTRAVRPTVPDSCILYKYYFKYYVIWSNESLQHGIILTMRKWINKEIAFSQENLVKSKINLSCI